MSLLVCLWVGLIVAIKYVRLYVSILVGKERVLEAGDIQQFLSNMVVLSIRVETKCPYFGSTCFG